MHCTTTHRTAMHTPHNHTYTRCQPVKYQVRSDVTREQAVVAKNHFTKPNSTPKPNPIPNPDPLPNPIPTPDPIAYFPCSALALCIALQLRA